MTNDDFLKELKKFPDRKQLAKLSKLDIRPRVSEIPFGKMIVSIRKKQIMLGENDLTWERWFKIAVFICFSKWLYAQDIHTVEFIDSTVAVEGERMIKGLATNGIFVFSDLKFEDLKKI